MKLGEVKDSTTHLAYIRNMSLPPTPSAITRTRGLREAPKDGEKGRFVDAGSLVSFVQGVSAQHQIDVLNSTMLAQLAADKKFNRQEDTGKWYDSYREVLENIGWVIQDLTFTKYETSGQTFDMDKAVLEILTALATQNELGAIKAAIDGARALASDDSRLTLFEHFSARGSKGCFQLGVASEQMDLVSLKIGAFYFHTNVNVTRFLWFKFSKKDTSLYHAIQSATLNAGVYKAVRQAIADKLGDRAHSFVDTLDA